MSKRPAVYYRAGVQNGYKKGRTIPYTSRHMTISQAYRGGQRRFKKGYDRKVGYYGRFAGRGGEWKFHDVDSDDAVIVTGGAIDATINIIAQGTGESQRIGRKLTIRKILWRYSVKLPTTIDPNNTADTVRVILYQDKQTNGVTATILQILETADWQSFRNLAESGRFKILVDNTHPMKSFSGGGATATSFGEDVLSRQIYLNVNIPIEYNGVTGALTEVRSNNLGVLLITESGVAGFFSKFRLRYSDN